MERTRDGYGTEHSLREYNIRGRLPKSKRAMGSESEMVLAKGQTSLRRKLYALFKRARPFLPA